MQFQISSQIFYLLNVLPDKTTAMANKMLFSWIAIPQFLPIVHDDDHCS